jgi:hypothetical protein
VMMRLLDGFIITAIYLLPILIAMWFLRIG